MSTPPALPDNVVIKKNSYWKYVFPTQIIYYWRQGFITKRNAVIYILRTAPDMENPLNNDSVRSIISLHKRVFPSRKMIVMDYYTIPDATFDRSTYFRIMEMAYQNLFKLETIDDSDEHKMKNTFVICGHEVGNILLMKQSGDLYKVDRSCVRLAQVHLYEDKNVYYIRHPSNTANAARVSWSEVIRIFDMYVNHGDQCELVDTEFVGLSADKVAYLQTLWKTVNEKIESSSDEITDSVKKMTLKIDH